MAEPYTKCADAQCELDQYFPSRSNCPMSGSSNKIEIFKPFGEAFELMKKILFQPFDLKKCLVIGFVAFLAALSGGFGSSFNPFSRWSSRDHNAIGVFFRVVPSVVQMEWWMHCVFV